VGAGVEGNATCTRGHRRRIPTLPCLRFGFARAPYRPTVSRLLWSGIGVSQLWRDDAHGCLADHAEALPYAIADTFFGDFTLYQPQVVVINLGTNDFGSVILARPMKRRTSPSFRRSARNMPSAYFILIDMYGGNRLTRHQ